MKVRFLHTPKPRRFDYKPRYYDPEKEAMERRRDELLGARPTPGKEYVPGEIIRSRMGARQEALRQRRQGKGKTILLVAAILALIAAGVWILMTS